MILLLIEKNSTTRQICLAQKRMIMRTLSLSAFAVWSSLSYAEPTEFIVIQSNTLGAFNVKSKESIECREFQESTEYNPTGDLTRKLSTLAQPFIFAENENRYELTNPYLLHTIVHEFQMRYPELGHREAMSAKVSAFGQTIMSRRYRLAQHILNSGFDTQMRVSFSPAIQSHSNYEGYENSTDWDALSFAVYAGNYNLFRKLIEKGADIARINCAGRNLLHIAASGSNRAWKKRLPEAEPQVRNAGRTGFTRIVEFLIANGVSTYLKDSIGNTPLIYLVELDKERENESTFPVLSSFIESGHRFTRGEKFLYLNLFKKDHNLSYVKSILASSDDNRSLNAILLEYSAEYEKHSETLIRLLVEKGADINTMDPEGDTPLIRAVRGMQNSYVSASRKREFILFLLELGADKAIRNSSGMSAADYATSYIRDLVN